MYARYVWSQTIVCTLRVATSQIYQTNASSCVSDSAFIQLLLSTSRMTTLMQETHSSLEVWRVFLLSGEQTQYDNRIQMGLRYLSSHANDNQESLLMHTSLTSSTMCDWVIVSEYTVNNMAFPDAVLLVKWCLSPPLLGQCASSLVSGLKLSGVTDREVAQRHDILQRKFIVGHGCRASCLFSAYALPDVVRMSKGRLYLTLVIFFMVYSHNITQTDIYGTYVMNSLIIGIRISAGCYALSLSRCKRIYF